MELKLIYKILVYLQAEMNAELPDRSAFKADTFGVTGAQFNAVLRLLQEDGLINGCKELKVLGNAVPQMKPVSPHITIKGLEYLNANERMLEAKDELAGH